MTEEAPLPSSNPASRASLDTRSAKSKKVDKPKAIAASPGVRPDDHMAEAGRKIMRFHFQRMLQHETGSRSGKDEVAVHDMRVATRRLRAALRLVRPYFQSKAVDGFQSGLRTTGQTLGHLRDSDVFRAKAQTYLKKSGKGQKHSLDPLLDYWRVQRNEAHHLLVEYLDTQSYRVFVEQFGEFLQQEGAGVAPAPADKLVRCQVRHVLPSTVWVLYERVRVYELIVEDAPPASTLHALRIDCKRLRYALEFFQEVLGPETPRLIRDVVAVQDHLGALQDAQVAIGVIDRFLDQWQEQQGEDSSREMAQVAGVVSYLAARSEESQTLTATFPAKWALIASRKFRDRLAAALADL